MNLTELIKAADDTIVSDQDISKLENRLQEADKDFEKKQTTEEFLSRTYNI